MQELARTHRDELSHLQAAYEARLRSLAARMRSAPEAVAGDALLAAMARDPASAMLTTERLVEVLEASINSEQEGQIGRLCQQLAGCEAALDETRREAAAAAAALPQLTSTIEAQRALEASADAARAEAGRLTDALDAERRARTEAEEQLGRAHSTCGALEVRIVTVETELASTRRDAAAAIEAAEARARALEAAAAAQLEGQAGATAASASRLREAAAVAASADGERVLQIAALQAALLAVQGASAAAEEALRAQGAALDAARTQAESAARRADRAESAAKEKESAVNEASSSAAARVRAAEGEAESVARVAEREVRHAQELASSREGLVASERAAFETLLERERAASAQAVSLAAGLTLERDEARAERDATAERYRAVGKKVEQLVAMEGARTTEGREAALRARVLALEASLAETRSELGAWAQRLAQTEVAAAGREAGLVREQRAAAAAAHAEGVAEGEGRAAAEAAYRRGGLEACLESQGSELAASRAELQRALDELDAWRAEAEARREALREVEVRPSEIFTYVCICI